MAVNAYPEQYFICGVSKEGEALILDYQGDVIARDIAEVSPHLEDLGIEYPDEPGVYLWSGKITIDDGENFLPAFAYTGEFTRLYGWQQPMYPFKRAVSEIETLQKRNKFLWRWLNKWMDIARRQR